jgi:hypothetical protein
MFDVLMASFAENQELVDSFQGQSLFTPFADESQDSVGCTHLTHPAICFSLIPTLLAFIKGKLSFPFGNCPFVSLEISRVPTMGVP